MKKKIFLLIDSLGSGGAQRQFVGLARMLHKSNYEIVVVYYHRLLFYKPLLDEYNVKQYIIEANNNIKRILKIYYYIKKYNPDWVISFLDTPNIISCIAKLAGGKFKLLVSERNTTQVLSRREKLKFTLYRFATKIVANSFSQHDFIKKYYPSYASKLYVIPNFVDLNHFIFNKKHRKQSTIPEILIVASIEDRKNTLGFIDAVKLMKERNLHFIVKWYGLVDRYKDYSDKCNEKILLYGLSDVIQLLPKTRDILSKYLQADFFCLPSFYEGTPNVICEAMACGLPIACSNICDNALYVVEGKNGVLFDPIDPNSIADSIQRLLLKQDNEYEEYCNRSREIAQSKFSEKIFFDNYINIIEENDFKYKR